MLTAAPSSSKNLFVKDPLSSVLGQKLLKESARMLGEDGFDAFTLKKLAQNLQTTESSVYRYFDNKHRLLVYQINLYWGWLNQQVDLKCCQAGLSGKEALEKAFEIMCFPEAHSWPSDGVSFECMHKILTHQSVKAYFSEHVDHENQDGAHRALKSLVKQMSEWLKEGSPDFEFPKSLISTLLASVMIQPFYAEHLPSLTELPAPNPTNSQTAQQTFRYVCQILERLTTQPRTV
jgi:AcrR family transcriptional regulator